MQTIEIMYFVDFEDVDNREIIRELEDYAEELGCKPRKNISKNRIIIFDKNKTAVGGIQVIIYNDVLRTYRHLNSDVVGAYHYINITKICKTFPPTRKVISVTQYNASYPDNNLFATINLFISKNFKLWLKNRPYERRINVS